MPETEAEKFCREHPDDAMICIVASGRKPVYGVARQSVDSPVHPYTLLMQSYEAALKYLFPHGAYAKQASETVNARGNSSNGTEPTDQSSR